MNNIFNSFFLCLISATCTFSCGADSGAEPPNVDAKALTDPFSHKFEKALSIVASLSRSSGQLTVDIRNITNENVSFNKPVPYPAGNIYITGDLVSYPNLGSCVIGKDIRQLPPGKNVVFTYDIPVGDLDLKSNSVLQINFYIDSVNGENNRTHISGGRINVVD